MKKILVVGGAGYIGGLTTDTLTKKGYRVTVYDKLLYEPRYLKPVPFIFGDVRDTNHLLTIHKHFDEIIWLAAIVGDGACAHDPALTAEVNTHSIENFLSKSKRRLIFTSTCSVYGAQNGLLTENSPTNPLSIYAATKLEAEKSVLSHHGLVFRLGTLFGLGDEHSRIRLDLVVNIMTLRAFKNHELTVIGGEQWRPIIAVTDVANYLTEAINIKICDIFNVKYKNVTMSELANIVKQVFPEVKIKTTQLKFEDLRNYQVDSQKAEKVFHYRPIITVLKEVNKMRKLFNSYRIKDFEDDVYYNTNHVKKCLSNNTLT